MPKRLMRCVRKVVKKVKPRPGQTKKQAAFAICVASTGLKPEPRKRGKRRANPLAKAGKKKRRRGV